MTDLDIKLRFNVVNSEAAALGYRIGVEFEPNRLTPLYLACANPLVGQATFSKFLCSGSSSIEAAEDALDDSAADCRTWRDLA